MISAHLRVSAVNPDLIGTLGAAPPRWVHLWFQLLVLGSPVIESCPAFVRPTVVASRA